jgi:hypothetical protein
MAAPIFTTSTVITSTAVEEILAVDQPEIPSSPTVHMDVQMEEAAEDRTFVQTEEAQTSAVELPSTPGIDSDLFDLEEDLLQGFIRNFHDNIQRCVSLMTKGWKTPFSSMKIILTRSVDNIRDIGGDERAAPFDQIISDFERDVNLWKENPQVDISSFIAAEMEHLELKRQEA